MKRCGCAAAAAAGVVKRAKEEFEELTKQIAKQDEAIAMLLEMREKQMEMQGTLEALKADVDISCIYQNTSTTPLAAAFSLVEVAVQVASDILRRKVSTSLLLNNMHTSEVDVQTHLMRFRESFSYGYIKDVDYCQAVKRDFKAAGVSLKQYWDDKGYDGAARDVFCDKWIQTPEVTGPPMTPELTQWLEQTEREFAASLGVESTDLSLFLRLFCTAVRHGRKELGPSHFAFDFCMYKSTGKNPYESYAQRQGAGPPSNWQECRSRLEDAMPEYEERMVFSLKQVGHMYAIIRHLMRPEVISELRFFGEHQPVFEAIASFLLDKFPRLTATALSNSSTADHDEGPVTTIPTTGTFVRYNADLQVWQEKLPWNGRWVSSPGVWKLLIESA